MTFQDKLNRIISKHHSFLCIGLDSTFERLPQALRKSPHAQLVFNKAIIDRTRDLVCCYKPNSAFYESRGVEGIEQLKKTCDYIHETVPDVPIILDAKRGDIGSTNEGYATFAFEYLGVDAITLHPYPGKEALLPFLSQKDKGCVILCRTSNSGAGEFQDLVTDGIPLYQLVARTVARDWNTNDNCLLVVGATYPEELAKVRALVGNMTILVPGIGTQGGEIKKVMQAGLTKDKKGLVISVSRSIIFASHGNDFAKKAREEARKLRDTINAYRE